MTGVLWSCLYIHVLIVCWIWHVWTVCSLKKQITWKEWHTGSTFRCHAKYTSTLHWLMLVHRVYMTGLPLFLAEAAAVLRKLINSHTTSTIWSTVHADRSIYWKKWHATLTEIKRNRESQHKMQAPQFCQCQVIWFCLEAGSTGRRTGAALLLGAMGQTSRYLLKRQIIEEWDYIIRWNIC